MLFCFTQNLLNQVLNAVVKAYPKDAYTRLIWKYWYGKIGIVKSLQLFIFEAQF